MDFKLNESYVSVQAQKHLRWTMDGPHSSYSCLEIHICWKVDSEDRMEPPIQTEYFLSGGAMILILMVEGARAVISFCMRSAIPGYMVVPPDMTVLAYRSFLMSTSHFMSRVYLSVVADISWFYNPAVKDLRATVRRRSHAPDQENGLCKPVGGQPPNQMIGKELKYMEEAEHHPVSEPSVLFLLLLCHQGSDREVSGIEKTDESREQLCGISDHKGHSNDGASDSQQLVFGQASFLLSQVKVLGQRVVLAHHGIELCLHSLLDICRHLCVSYQISCRSESSNK